MPSSSWPRSPLLLRRLLRAAALAAQRFARGLGAVLGEGAYPAYVEHHRAVHPDLAPLDERAFWRERYRAQGSEPGGRCC
jgi:uncharacterized short protein YbdD (DUF466 family)